MTSWRRKEKFYVRDVRISISDIPHDQNASVGCFKRADRHGGTSTGCW